MEQNHFLLAPRHLNLILITGYFIDSIGPLEKLSFPIKYFCYFIFVRRIGFSFSWRLNSFDFFHFEQKFFRVEFEWLSIVSCIKSLGHSILRFLPWRYYLRINCKISDFIRFGYFFKGRKSLRKKIILFKGRNFKNFVFVIYLNGIGMIIFVCIITTFAFEF